MVRLFTAISLVALLSACTTVGADTQVEPDASSSASAPVPQSAVPPASSATTATPPASSSTTTTSPSPQQTSTTPEPAVGALAPISNLPPPSDPGVAAEVEITPVLSDRAAKPAPVVIVQPPPPAASFMVGANDTELTISFVASGNGRIDWFSQVLPSGPQVLHGKGPSIDITLTIPITEDTRSYLITADGRNRNAGEDTITIVLVRASS